MAELVACIKPFVVGCAKRVTLANDSALAILAGMVGYFTTSYYPLWWHNALRSTRTYKTLEPSSQVIIQRRYCQKDCACSIIFSLVMVPRWKALRAFGVWCTCSRQIHRLLCTSHLMIQQLYCRARRVFMIAWLTHAMYALQPHWEGYWLLSRFAELNLKTPN